MTLENREVKEHIDPRYADIYEKIGNIRGIVEGHDQDIKKITQSLIEQEKVIGASVQRLESGIQSIQKTLDINSALDKERQETAARIALDRRESDKLNKGLIPKFLDAAVKFCTLIGFLYALFTILQK